MARIVGSTGSASIGTHGITANAWSMSVSRVINDVTAFDDASTAVRGGIATFTGSLSGFMDDGSAPVASTLAVDGVAVTLIADSGNQWSGTAVISNVSVGTSMTGDATISFDFTFSGAVTEAWS